MEDDIVEDEVGLCDSSHILGVDEAGGHREGALAEAGMPGSSS